MKNYIVITTINEKNKALSMFEQQEDCHLVVVGDNKTPPMLSTERLTYLSVEDRLDLGFEFAKQAPYNHYARKNIGYLYAIEQGAEVIYDTDDDNLPTETWSLFGFSCQNRFEIEQKYVNIYRYFSEKNIWPRGYPLHEIRNCPNYTIANDSPASIGVWQGLVDRDPDVDAIYRLVMGENIIFDKRDPVYLAQGQYCPFNSQNTFWAEAAFSYLYLPATTSFRFTDILRGYIAQRLMWEQGLYLGFRSAHVYQERNPHDLMSDFKQEIECYLGVPDIVNKLDDLELTGEPLNDLETVYQALEPGGYVTALELQLCQAWKADLSRIISKREQAAEEGEFH